MQKSISVVIPCHNEADNIDPIFKSVNSQLANTKYSYSIIFVDDGSADNTDTVIKKVIEKNKQVKLLCLSRNFGKEIAVSAGIHLSSADATLIIDADGQHPPDLIPEFIAKWEEGAQVVVGVRKLNKKEGRIKKYGSKIFYRLFNRFSGTHLVPGSTDFRLIDKEVRIAFEQLEEQNRITRGLVDWLGYKREFVSFRANERLSGAASYSPKKLTMLAIDSFTSLSFAPLYFFGYVGLFITFVSLCSGVFILIEQYILGDPIGLHLTGSAVLGILILFIVGIVLISQGIMSLYISKIYSETKQRPLYLIDKSRSIF